MAARSSPLKIMVHTCTISWIAVNSKLLPSNNIINFVGWSCDEHSRISVILPSLPTPNSLLQLIPTLDGVVSVVEYVVNISLTAAIPPLMGSLVVAMCSPGLVDVPPLSVVVKQSLELFAFVSLSAASPFPSFIVTPLSKE